MDLKHTFSKIARSIFAATRTQPNAVDRGSIFSFFNVANAGVAVTHERAMQEAAVWGCMDVIAAALSSSDWNVYAGIKGDDRKESLSQADGLQYVLNTRWNPEMTAQAAKRALLLCAVGYGNGYAEIERDLAGRIIALWPLVPERCDPRRDLETGELFYRITHSQLGGFVDLDHDEVFHVRGAGLAGFMGDDAIGRAIKSIAQSVAMTEFASAYFGNSAQLGTVFLYKNAKLDDPHYERLKEQLDKRHQGPKRAFSTAIMDGGEWDVKQIGADADKAQMVEAREMSVESICAFFHVPPHKIAHLTKSTNNNIEHQGLEFTRDTLRPWAKEIEQEADYKLVPMRVSKFVELDLDWAEQGDYKSRAEAYQILRNIGVFNANDILRKMGENTIGADGDIRIVQGAMIKLKDVGKAYDKAVTTAPTEPAAPAAWLESIYSRVMQRYDARSADLSRNGIKDWDSKARDAVRPWCLEQVSAMNEVLSPEQLASAYAWMEQVLGGCDPRIAATAALEKMQ